MPRGGVAGLQSLEFDHPRLKNIDLSEIVSGHGDYYDHMPQILRKLNVRVLEDPEGVASTKSESSLSVPNPISNVSPVLRFKLVWREGNDLKKRREVVSWLSALHTRVRSWYTYPSRLPTSKIVPTITAGQLELALGVGRLSAHAAAQRL